MKEEYLMLRDEILHLSSNANNTITIFYAFVATYFAFAFSKDESMYMLISYIAIFPAYMIVLSDVQGMNKIGGYLSVFHEKEVNGFFNWETMNIKFYEKNKPQWYKHMTSNMPFLFSSSVITVYVIYDTYKINKLGNISGYELFKLFIALCLFTTIFIIYLLNKDMNTKKFADKWKELIDKD